MSEPTAKVLSVKLTRFNPANPPPANFAATNGRIFLTPKDAETPSLLVKIGRLKTELKVWARNGLPLATGAVRKARLAVCASCEYYNPRGNLGMGECKAPGCGCSRIKAALATSKCPKGKWAQ